MVRRVMMWVIVCLVIFAGAAGAQEKEYRAGDIYRTFSVDLDGNGSREKIDIRIYAVKDEGWYASIVASDSRGRKLWSSPADTKGISQYLFGSWDWGSSLPEIIGALDNDSKADMIVPAPVSDVRPVSFRLYHWSGDKFRFLSERALICDAADPDQFKWTSSQGYKGTWIGAFEKLYSDRTCLVKIWSYKEGDESCKMGEATVRANEKGFRILKWIKPLK